MTHRVLVVDDEESLRYTFHWFLTDEGYSVSTAETFEKAVEKINIESFDIVFADIVLHNQSGMDLLKIVKDKNPSCPVIMITGYPNIDTASEAVRLGAFDYIKKPVTKNVLLSTAKLALDFKAVLDENIRYRKNHEAIFRSVKDGIITVDKYLNITEFNEAAKRICSCIKEGKEKPFEKLLNRCNGVRCFMGLKQTIEEKKAVELHRMECRRKGRPCQIVSTAITPLIDNRGSLFGAVMVIRDETPLVNMERSLEERRSFHNIIGKSNKLEKIYILLEKLADVPTTVLVTGESGTGKELIGEALHYKGCRKDKPLIKINCSALPETLLESELFGHVKGAFTGAIKDKEGKFEAGDGGTIFLDEIGDISPAIQLRLLRIIQERVFERVGDNEPVKVDVRIVAATNQNLVQKIREGQFREDLYYRLNIVEINLPPLRERTEDIPLLAEHFIKKFNKKLGKNITSLSHDVRKIFMDYHWPGNIRELENVIEHSFVICHGQIITVSDLPVRLREGINSKITVFGGEGDEAERIKKALKQAGGNKAKAARILGINRKTLYRKLKKYKMDI